MEKIKFEERTRLLAVMDGLMLAASLFAVVSLVAYHGFELSPEWQTWIRVADFCVLGFFVLQWGTRWFWASDRRDWLRRHWPLVVLSGLIVGLLGLAAGLVPLETVRGWLGADSEQSVRALYLGLCHGMLLVGAVYHFSRRTIVLAQM
ncbi:MAG: hypothetical protein SNJ84_09690, partial [Verrucomicrobiia bacterium]